MCHCRAAMCLGQDLPLDLLEELCWQEHWKPLVWEEVPFVSSFLFSFRNARGNARVLGFFFCVYFLIKYKVIIYKGRDGQEYPCRCMCSPSFPSWPWLEPLPGCMGDLSQRDSSHALVLPACSKSITGSPAGWWAAPKYRFSSWNYIVFSVLAVMIC